MKKTGLTVVFIAFLVILTISVKASPFSTSLILKPLINNTQQIIQPKPIAPFCDNLREVPIPWAPANQMINSFKLVDRYILYNIMPQQTYSQQSLILLDMGRDKRLFTQDDSPIKYISDTLDTTVHAIDISNNKVAWVQNVPGLINPELRECDINTCDSNSNLIYTGDSQYNLVDNSVAISGTKIIWLVLNIGNRISPQAMFCDTNLNGQLGGCLQTDNKNVINLNIIGSSERVAEIKTTNNFGYILTQSASGPAIQKLYIINYASLTYSVYYDESIDNAQLRSFNVVDHQNFDALYTLSNNGISYSYIGSGTETFSGRANIITTSVDIFNADKISSNLFDFSYLQRNTASQSYMLKSFLQAKTYYLDRQTYQQMNNMQYSGNSYMTMNNNGHPAYMYCN